MDVTAMAETGGAGGPEFAHIVLGAVLIFACRITDMSIDTLRVISLVKGHRYRAALFGFLEAGIFIVALATVLRPPIHWIQMLGYAGGFGVGTLTGVTIGRRISSELLLMRVLSRARGSELCEALRGQGFAVTAVTGEGRDGPVLILFSVIPRRLGQRALELIRGLDEKAFVVLEPIETVVGGYVPRFVGPGLSVRR